ncbi:Gfo/Idh/MocA family protein [Albibacterium indicum]|uniref:Gfo/Idh/MocA family protein n=1 Tax=Albibacterium indicum TaxID=2292082 RepID=UPI000E4D00AC|nr:Gfo/Idh/MocA family oxidoreductase [Pedobacter indicus]
MSTNRIDRRKFLASSAVGLSGMLASTSSVFAQENFLSTSKKAVRIGVIGTGKRGLGLINTIAESVPQLQVVACCDLIPENLQAALQKAGKKAKGYTDYEKLLADRNVDAVIVSTPLYLHYPMAVAALERNKHVYVEKSMAFTIKQALDMVRRVRESNLVLQVGFQYRNFPLYHKVKEIIQKGTLGGYSVECQYNRAADWRYPVKDPSQEKLINWRLYRDLCGGPLSELCAHQIDIVGYLVGSRPAKTVGIGGIDFFDDGRTTHDNVRTIYEYENKVKAAYTSVYANEGNPYQIRVIGQHATIEIGRSNAFIYTQSKNPKQTLGIVDGVTGATLTNDEPGKKVQIPYLEPGEKRVEPTLYALQDFYNCIADGGTPLSNVSTGRDSAIAICMGLDAMETGETQHWKPEYSI